MCLSAVVPFRGALIFAAVKERQRLLPRRCWRFLAQGLSQQLCLRVLLSGQCHCHHCHQQRHAGHPPAARGRPAGLQDREHRVGGVGGDLHVADHAFTAGNTFLVGKRGINSGVIDYGVIDSAVIDSERL